MNIRLRKKKIKRLLEKYTDKRMVVTIKDHNPCHNCKYRYNDCWTDCDGLGLWYEYINKDDKVFNSLLKDTIKKFPIESHLSGEYETDIKWKSIFYLRTKFDINDYYIELSEYNVKARKPDIFLKLEQNAVEIGMQERVEIYNDISILYLTVRKRDTKTEKIPYKFIMDAIEYD